MSAATGVGAKEEERGLDPNGRFNKVEIVTAEIDIETTNSVRNI